MITGWLSALSVSAQCLRCIPHVAEPRGALQENIDANHWALASDLDRPLEIMEHPFLFMLSDDEAGDQAAIRRPVASWRRHLLTQPPVAEVTACSDTKWRPMSTITSEIEGVRMGEVAGIGSRQQLLRDH